MSEQKTKTVSLVIFLQVIVQGSCIHSVKIQYKDKKYPYAKHNGINVHLPFFILHSFGPEPDSGNEVKIYVHVINILSTVSVILVNILTALDEI